MQEIYRAVTLQRIACKPGDTQYAWSCSKDGVRFDVELCREAVSAEEKKTRKAGSDYDANFQHRVNFKRIAGDVGEFEALRSKILGEVTI